MSAFAHAQHTHRFFARDIAGAQVRLNDGDDSEEPRKGCSRPFRVQFLETNKKISFVVLAAFIIYLYVCP